ncbi:MAG: (4Fe-4S)-binding protein [Candidatus Eisenbacteria bacterium]|nr:(4Fe-4S)-binding protein [Candidatus Eisenbacteria bacterium]
MRIAIASGKGGTGKTTLAVGLALTADRPLQLLDCDVEEPNCHLFLQPAFHDSRGVGIPIPKVDVSRCTVCGRCGEICQYNAIVALRTRPLVFPELCHGCGGCLRVCPEEAITEAVREIGVVERAQCGSIDFAHGRLRVGEALSPPLIRAVLEIAEDGEGITLIDAPPGTACPVVAALRRADCAVLVTEPTPFGQHDLELAVEVVRKLDLPFGVVINRAGSGDDRVQRYCAAESIPILQEIPDDRRVAECYSRGEVPALALPEQTLRYRELFGRIVELAQRSGSAHLGEGRRA